MVVASLIVSVFAVLIAAAGLWWTIHRDRSQTSALEKESEERKAADAREEERRDEELELLRAQVARLAASDEAGRSAVLIGEPSGWSGAEHGVTYTIRVRNAGAAAARDVEIWIAEANGGHATSRASLPVVMPAEPPVKCSVALRPMGGQAQRPAAIYASWADENGEKRDQVIGRAELRV